tara:strand:- start:551 stop:838 length:288 start_codon:yes stop_codon:yes gene_type:complete
MNDLHLIWESYIAEGTQTHYAEISVELGVLEDGTRSALIEIIPFNNPRVVGNKIVSTELIKVKRPVPGLFKHPFYFVKLKNQHGLKDGTIISFSQ